MLVRKSISQASKESVGWAPSRGPTNPQPEATYYHITQPPSQCVFNITKTTSLQCLIITVYLTSIIFNSSESQMSTGYYPHFTEKVHEAQKS